MSRRYAGAVALILFALASGACKKRESPAVAFTGIDIYKQRCAICHGDDCQGRPGAGPALRASQWVVGPPARLAAIVLGGMQGPSGPVIPGWGGTLRDVEIAQLITWLRRREGRGPYSAVQVSAVRLRTESHNAFWTPDDLRTLEMP